MVPAESMLAGESTKHAWALNPPGHKSIGNHQRIFRAINATQGIESSMEIESKGPQAWAVMAEHVRDRRKRSEFPGDSNNLPARKNRRMGQPKSRDSQNSEIVLIYLLLQIRAHPQAWLLK